MVEHHYFVFDVAAAQAKVYDEIHDGSYTVDPITKQPPQGPDQRDVYKDIYYFEKTDAGWKITKSVRQQLYPNGRPLNPPVVGCAARRHGPRPVKCRDGIPSRYRVSSRVTPQACSAAMILGSPMVRIVNRWMPLPSAKATPAGWSISSIWR